MMCRKPYWGTHTGHTGYPLEKLHNIVVVVRRKKFNLQPSIKVLATAAVV